VARNVLLPTALVVGLLVGFGASYAVSSSQISSLQNSLKQANDSNTMLHGELQNTTLALALVAKPGQTIRSGWILISPIGSGHYALSLHAEGLQPASAGAYIIEVVPSSGSGNMVPISGNATTASEFEADTGGVGNYWYVLMENPSASFKGIDLLFLPGMDMTRATLVATAQLG